MKKIFSVLFIVVAFTSTSYASDFEKVLEATMSQYNVLKQSLERKVPEKKKKYLLSLDSAFQELKVAVEGLQSYIGLYSTYRNGLCGGVRQIKEWAEVVTDLLIGKPVRAQGCSIASPTYDDFPRFKYGEQKGKILSESEARDALKSAQKKLLELRNDISSAREDALEEFGLDAARGFDDYLAKLSSMIQLLTDLGSAVDFEFKDLRRKLGKDEVTADRIAEKYESAREHINNARAEWQAAQQDLAEAAAIQ